MLFRLESFGAILQDLGRVEGSRSLGARYFHTLTLLLPLSLLLVCFTEARARTRSLTSETQSLRKVSAAAAARLMRFKEHLRHGSSLVSATSRRPSAMSSRTRTHLRWSFTHNNMVLFQHLSHFCLGILAVQNGIVYKIAWRQVVLLSRLSARPMLINYLLNVDKFFLCSPHLVVEQSLLRP